jgi:nitrite reductase/ring-hydroxylating ferredoxin subunit
MRFVRAASIKKLGAGKMIGLELGDKMVLLVNSGGIYYGIGNRCTHMGCMLSDGRLRNDLIQCPCHGSVFNVKTGRVVRGPAQEPEHTFEVRLQGDDIQVNV